MHKLENRIALVFGAGSSGSGLSNGKAASIAYARQGAHVVAVDVNENAVQETAGAIRAEGGECVTMIGNVRAEPDIARVISETVARLGAVDVLHNNVGTLKLGGPTELSSEDWDAAMEINVRSVFLACKHALPHMKARKRGVITNISSIAGTRWCGRPMSGYSASKAAINHLSATIAVEYAPHGIRCNTIAPGLINTPLVVEPYAAIYGDVDRMIAERDALCPTGKMGTAWDVAHAAVFLASDEAAYINGVLLPVDGGLSCKSF